MQNLPATQQPCLSSRVRFCCQESAYIRRLFTARSGRVHLVRPPSLSYKTCLCRMLPDIGFYAGRKSRIESFAGANITYTIEAMMGDRRALQVCHT